MRLTVVVRRVGEAVLGVAGVVRVLVATGRVTAVLVAVRVGVARCGGAIAVRPWEAVALPRGATWVAAVLRAATRVLLRVATLVPRRPLVVRVAVVTGRSAPAAARRITIGLVELGRRVLETVTPWRATAVGTVARNTCRPVVDAGGRRDGSYRWLGVKEANVGRTLPGPNTWAPALGMPVNPLPRLKKVAAPDRPWKEVAVPNAAPAAKLAPLKPAFLGTNVFRP